MFRAEFFSIADVTIEKSYTVEQLTILRRIVIAGKYWETHPNTTIPFVCTEEDLSLVRMILAEHAQDQKITVHEAADFYLSRIELCGAAYR